MKTLLLVCAGLCLLTVPTRAGVDVVINEVDADQVGTDAAEFVELFNAGGGLPLDRYFLVFYNGNAPGDAEYLTVALAGHVVPSDGFFVVGSATVRNVDFTPPGWPAINAIQNGQDAVALWFDSSGALTAASFANSAAAAPPPGAVLIDALVYDTTDADDPALLLALTPGQPQIDENGSTLAGTESIQRVPDGGAPLVTTRHFTKAPTPGMRNAPMVPWVNLGCPLAGLKGRPKLAGQGVLVPGTPGALMLSDARPSSLALLLISLSVTSVPFKGGTLKPIPAVFQLVLPTNAAGELTLAWSNWPGGLEGIPLYVQYAIADAAAPQGVALSNAISGTPVASLPHAVPIPAALAAAILDHVSSLTAVVQAALPASNGGRTVLTYIRDQSFPLYVRTLKEELVLKERADLLPAVSLGAQSGFAGIATALVTKTDAELNEQILVAADLGMLAGAFPPSLAGLQAELAAQTGVDGNLVASADINGLLWSLLSDLLECIPGLEELLKKLLGYAHDVAHLEAPATSLPTSASVASLLQTELAHSSLYVSSVGNPTGGRLVVQFARDVTWPLWFSMANDKLQALGLNSLGSVMSHFQSVVTQDLNALLALPDSQLNALVFAKPTDLDFSVANLDLIPRLQGQLAAQTTFDGGLCPGSVLAAISWDDITLLLKCLPDEFRKILELIHKILHGKLDFGGPTPNALIAMDIMDDMTNEAIALQGSPTRGRQFLQFLQADTVPRTLAILQSEMFVVAPELYLFFAYGQSDTFAAISLALGTLSDAELNAAVYDGPAALQHALDFQFATFGNPATSQLALDDKALWDQLVEYLECFLKKWWKWGLKLVHAALHL